MYSSTSTMSGRGYYRGQKRGQRGSSSKGYQGGTPKQQQHHSHYLVPQTPFSASEKFWYEAEELLKKVEIHGGQNDPDLGRRLGESLDNLNKITYPLANAQTEVLNNVLRLWCKMLENKGNEDDLMSSKFCQLIATLSVKQDMAYSAEDGTRIVYYLVHLAKNSQTWLLVDALRTLSYVLLDVSPKISPDLHKEVLEVALPLARLSNPDAEARKQAINCLGNMCTRTGASLSQYYGSIFNVLFENFESYSKQILGDFAMFKILNCTMRAMINIVTESKETPRVADFVAHLRKLMFFGTKLMPLPTLVSSFKRSKTEERDIFASDSDFSDGEGGGENRETMRVRIQALQVISTLAKTNFKAIFAEWKNLVPDQSGLLVSQPLNPTLSTVLLFDNCSRCRTAAAQTFAAILDNSRLFLAQADDAVTRSAFTPFSHTLFAMIREIHFTFIRALEAETSSPTLVHILKAFSVLIENAPYEKFKNFSILPQIIGHLHKLILSPDRSIQNIALVCLASVFGTREPISDVQKVLDGRIAAKDLLPILFDLFGENHASIVRVEAAQVLGHIAKNYPHVIQAQWNKLVQLLQFALANSDQALRLAAIQIMNSLTSSGHNELLESLDKEDTHKPTPAKPTKKPIQDVMTAEMWLTINKLLANSFKDTFQTVKAVTVAIYANISPSLFATLYKDTVFGQEVMSHIMYSAKDKTASVRASACRTLGVFVTFPILRDNIPFIDEVTQKLQHLLRDEILNVRIRACWALANLCDAMRQAKWTPMLGKENLKPKELQERQQFERVFLQEAVLVLNTSNDNDKVRANTVRALGNLASFASSSLLTQSLRYVEDKKLYVIPAKEAVWKARVTTGQQGEHAAQISLEEAISRELVNALTSINVKVRWNSCYAIGNYLNNQLIKLPVDNVVNELCQALAIDKNYKVRIQAAWALSFIQNAHGIKCENKVWDATLKAYLNAAEATDYKEYKYVRTLMRQLRLTITHLLEIAYLDHEQDDIKNIIVENADLIVTVLHEEISYLNMELKETSPIFTLCEKLLRWFLSRPNLHNEETVITATRRLEKMLKFKELEQQAYA